MLLGFLLFYVGAVLFLNGLWLMDRIQDREIVVINIVSGLVAVGVVIQGAFGTDAEIQSVRAAALTLMFATTYLWVAYNRLVAVDGRGLGWFSLFVAITTVPVFLRGISGAQSMTEVWLAGNWLIWGVLWFMYFLLLALGRPILRQTAWVTLLAGIVTGWLPGFLLLDGLM
ncbi:AmiS/UreI family transporter [Paracoccus sp. R12_1]|uniref:AmiS/UreI family transporter n=1 Tax=unclassified Paracoccus (in: a-proteobacteria) TaxID=2688777 RepID=UPI000C0B7FA7|nr:MULTISPECIES: AmiS/UreI family transporter [unclassified Paracoccus (in: a-proteobacteria)]MBO9455853.1 AmiS/UreI family transporter [Paracoccus sp. R12_2]MBO9488459.1 AmiS/UreI family transporter [Paracoccus sp. R12_1]PHQ69978.1 MAG: transporter [Paracoccus sp. (in: a-proteobacteria)]